MKDYINLDSAPYEESCAQVGTPDYKNRAYKELYAYREQIKRMFPIEANLVTLKIKSNQHDFGTYYDLIAEFDDTNEEQTEAAYFLENNMPATWDDEAIKTLEDK